MEMITDGEFLKCDQITPWQYNRWIAAMDNREKPFSVRSVQADD